MTGGQGLTLGFLGDLAFNGRYGGYTREVWQARFAEARRFFQDADFVVGNLECSLGEGGGARREQGIPVKTTAAGLEGLVHLGVGAVNLANNHVFDCGPEGFRALAAWLDERGIVRFGAGETEEAAEQPAVVRVKDRAVGFLGFCGKETHPFVPPGCGLSLLDEDRAAEAVARLQRSADLVVVHLHWGEEWCSLPSPAQRRLAHRLAEAGAHVIAGHHGHALKGWERAGPCPVFYDLGNGAFDHVTREGRVAVRQTALTQECGLVKVCFEAREPRVVAATGWGSPEEGLRLQPEWAALSRMARLRRRLEGPLLGPRYFLHRWVRNARMKYWNHYLRTLGPGECLRRLAAVLLRRRKNGPVILYGAGKGGGYGVRYHRFLQNLGAIRREAPASSFLLVVPEGDALARGDLPPEVTLHTLGLAGRLPALRLLWIHLVLPVLAWWKRAPAVVALNGFGPAIAPCERIVFVNNARPLSPLFPALPGLPARTRRYVRVQRFFMGVGLRRATRIGVQREGLVKEIRAWWKIPRDRFVVVPNCTGQPGGAGKEPPGPGLREQYPGRVIFLCPTLYGRHKNLELLPEAMEIYRRRYEGGPPVLLALTLDGNARGYEPGAAALAARIARSPARDAFLLLGERPPGVMAALYGSADGVLYPSVCDAFSAVFLEAMARGLPVVAADLSHAREVCGTGAFYFTWNDPASLAAVLHRVARDPRLRASLGAQGHARAARFTEEAETRAMTRLLFPGAGGGAPAPAAPEERARAAREVCRA